MSRSPSRRQCLLALAAVASCALAPRAGAQPAGSAAFPTHPIRLIVPWSAGGATDLCFRILADVAGRHLGQGVVVENRPGAGGTLAMPILPLAMPILPLAMPILQQAAPDGYTIAQLPYPVLRIPHTQNVAWDPVRDTTPIIQLSGVTFGVVVPASSPWRRFNDLLQFAAARPGQLMAGVNSNGFAPYADSGRLRLLVTFGEQRAKRWPHVHTLKELGYSVVAASPYDLVGPAGMDAATVQVLHDAFRIALFDPAHLQELAKYDRNRATSTAAITAPTCVKLTTMKNAMQTSWACNGPIDRHRRARPTNDL